MENCRLELDTEKKKTKKKGHRNREVVSMEKKKIKENTREMISCWRNCCKKKEKQKGKTKDMERNRR